MIHDLHSMTIRLYSKMEQTGNSELLKRWYNPFPISWFDTQGFFEEFKRMLGDDSDQLVENERYRMISYNRILILDRLLRTIGILMQDFNHRQMYGLLFDSDVEDNTNLKIYIQKVKDMTGIDVSDGLESLVKLQKDIQRKIDKFIERFQDKKIDTKVDFMDIVLGVFMIMETSYLPDMSLNEFGRLKKLSDKRIKRMDNVKNK